MCLYGVAYEHAGDVAGGIQRNIHDEVVPGHLGNLQQFMMKWVLLDRSFAATRMLDEVRMVESFNRQLAGTPWRHKFPPPEKPAIKWGSMNPVVILRSASQ